MASKLPLQTDLVGSEAHLTIDQSVYCREAVLRAAHWYTDRFLLTISSPNSETLSVTLRAKEKGHDIERAAQEFENSLVDAQLRVEIGRETAGIRELIVAKALAEGDLLDEAPTGEWRELRGSEAKRR